MKSIAIPALSLTIGLLLSLFLGELVVRMSGLSTPLAYLPNPLYGWSHAPGNEYVKSTEGTAVDVRINSLGLRDFERPRAKAPGQHRTLVLGDSFAEALQVPLEKSFPKLIERQLNDGNVGPRPEREVLNAGTSGYGTDNALLFLRHEGLQYDPDIVLLALYIGNDIRNNWFLLENIDAGGARKPYFTPGPDSLELNAFPFAAHESASSRIKVFLNQNLRLYSLLRETRDRLRTRAPTGDGTQAGIQLDTHLFGTEYDANWESAWQVTRGLLLELSAEAEAHGAVLFVALIPTRFQVHEAYWRERLENSPAMRRSNWDIFKPNRILGAFLAEHEIAYVDLLPEFRLRAEQTGREYYLPLDHHWNDAGHALAAELIGEALPGVSTTP